MYIKSVVIDGFKSYAQRTEIHGFDPQFNAITGLNGSGKSNILDSICFLLGISNLQQVRATSLQELIYKNGQAGITKATVSITFDNRDKQQSPLGYEQCDEITVTRQIVFEGRNKYLINGTNANNMRVQDMFRSVQLNVNNPHFLIMQGRITKVLNMKPPEILSMIEEAAGTRLYESKKEVAQKTIEKKDAKMKEIDSILKEEITPTLNRLKEERASYLEYQNVNRDLEHLTKLYIAYQFVCAEEVRKQSGEELIEIKEKIQEMTRRSKEIEEQVAELNELIEELQRKRDKEAGGVMEKREAELTEHQKVEAKAQAALTNKKDTVKQEQKKLQQLKKQLKSDETTKGNKLKELDKLADGHKALLEQHKKDEEAHVQSQKHFHAVSAGLSSNTDGEDASLQDQLMNSKKEVSNCETETKMAEMRLKHAKQEVKKKQADLKKTESTYGKDASGQKALQDSIKKIQAEMAKLNYEDGKEEGLHQQRTRLAQEIHALQDKCDSFTARYSQLNFNYRDPEPHFDRSKIKGLIAKLIKINDTRNATALEVAAGGKLYNVVVDTEQTGKKLLQNGQLQRRVTIIPLNKIAGRSIDERTVKNAERVVGKNNVSTALSLIGYERDLQTAMQYVFGTAFICPDMNTAKQVTYHKDVMRKSVTLAGESFDPAGTLTGGARAQLDSVLTKICELNNMENELYQKQNEIEQIDNELSNLKRTADRYREHKYQLEMKTHEANLLEERLKQSTHHQQLEEVSTLQKSIEDSENILKEAEETRKKAIKKISELEDKIKNAKSLREEELQNAEKAMNNLKKDLEKSRKVMKEKQQEVDSIKLEVEGLEKDMKNCEDEIKSVEEAVGCLDEQTGNLEEELNKCKASVKEAQEKVNQQKDLLKECNKDINEKINQLKALTKEGKNIEIAIKEAEHKVTKCNSSAKDAAKQVEALLQKYNWIVEEKKYFGQPKTAYDFKENDPKEAGKKIEKLQETKNKLAKSINMRAMSMLSKTEEQYNDLIRKRQIVLNDKAKIAAVIAELDEKKNEALKKAHTQVNKDFGSIFSALLPGTQAKLIAPEGCSILQGLEVKVAFGEVWKESLTELSGGQRSLVALSLILSLLLFKPAPIYILDEVDAALDISHTQNIGQMLRTHFTHSQFIVVSLKDGMFNNANVLFKTKFVDGVSTVQRFTQLQPTRGVLTASEKANALKDKNKNKNKRQKQDGASALSIAN